MFLKKIQFFHLVLLLKCVLLFEVCICLHKSSPCITFDHRDPVPLFCDLTHGGCQCFDLAPVSRGRGFKLDFLSEGVRRGNHTAVD